MVRLIPCLACFVALTAGFAAATEVRYLANAGHDDADGKTPATAWRTLEKLGANLPAGATACLKCGDTFYGEIILPDGRGAEHPTTLTSWGEGPKPVISATKNLKPDPAIWQNRSHDFWRVALTNAANFTGISTANNNPGFLLVDGAVKPWKRYCHDDLVSPWDFCGEEGWLYVHAPQNPATLAKDIRVALQVYCVQFGSFTIVSNIAVRATGAHGMHGGWGCDLKHVRILDCELENIGGSELMNFSKQMRIRYGNGIELGGDAEDVVIDRCTFRGVYDVAFTMQGFPKKGWRDVHCRNCTMVDCTQAFEIWCKKAPQGVGFARCSFTGNHTLRVGGGWGALVRPMREVATPLLAYMLETDTVDINVEGNTFEAAPYGLIYKSGGLDQLPKGYRIGNNAYRKVAGKTALAIDDKLPAGNVIVEKIEGDTVTLRMDMRDTDGDWIYWKFRVLGAAGRTLHFKFTKPHSVGSRSACVSRDRGKTWMWADEIQPAADREPETQDHPYWAAFDWKFAPHDDEVWFCQTIPYDPSDWRAFLDRHAADRGRLFEEGCLCSSRKGSNVEYVRLGRIDGQAPYRIFLSSRHHCQETTATFVLEGILEQVFADDNLGAWLRANVEFRVVPFVDKDGVLDGDQGKRRKPHDYARDYGDESPAIYPEVAAIMKMLRAWQPTIVNDFHCPWIRGNWFRKDCSDEYIYQVGLSRAEHWAKQQAFGRILERVQTAGLAYHARDDYAYGCGWNTSANYTKGKTLIAWYADAFPQARLVTTLEIPFANQRFKTLHPAEFRAWGRDVAAAYRAFLNPTNGQAIELSTKGDK